MSALLADPLVPSPRVAGRRSDPVFVPGAAAAVRPFPLERELHAGHPSSARYELTTRGLAVVLALVALVTSVMVTTLVVAFLAVSDEPIVAPASTTALVASAGR